jgi:cation:H+ antiporter
MPETLLAVTALVLGAVLLTAGAEAFAEHITEAASRLRVSVLAFGLLLAGAEPEEAVTAMVAAGQGHAALAAGDAIGANLVILTLTVGLAAVLAPLSVAGRIVEYAGAAAAAGLLAVLVMRNGVLGRGEATLLVFAYVVGVVWVWRRERCPPLIGQLAELAEEQPCAEPTRRQAAAEPTRRQAAAEPTRRQAGGPVLLVLLGLLGMVAGGFLAVRGAQGLVAVLGATESVVGLTVLALATSAEMLALVVAAHRRGVTEIALAGAVGSVAYNATITLGLAAWVNPLLLGGGSPVLTIGVATAVLPLVLLAGRRTGVFPRWLGLVLVTGYLAATAWLLSS